MCSTQNWDCCEFGWVIVIWLLVKCLQMTIKSLYTLCKNSFLVGHSVTAQVLLVLLKLNSYIDLCSSSWHAKTFLQRILQSQLGVCGTVRLSMERQVGMITQQDLIWTCVYTGHTPGMFINFTAPHLCVNLHSDPDVKFYFFFFYPKWIELLSHFNMKLFFYYRWIKR